MKKRGFTLIELLVVISIIALLIGILLPALGAARESALSAASQNNISVFGRGFMIYASDQKRGELSSGAFDHLRDGDVTRVGWVRDLIENAISIPGDALDPANPFKVNEKVADYTGAATTGTANNTVKYPGSAMTFGGTTYTAGNSTYAIWAKGYNSNYATTWHFSRGDVQGSTSDAYSTNGDTSDPSKCPRDGDGPLNNFHLGPGGNVGPAQIALMGAARAGDASDSAVTTTYAQKINDFAGKDVIRAGDFTVESFTDGPANDAGAIGYPGVKMHEFNDIVPVHKGKGSNGVGGFANVLFADGHVARVYDTDGENGEPDGWLGAYKVGGSGSTFGINPGAYTEIEGVMWPFRIRPKPTAGGGSNEL